MTTTISRSNKKNKDGQTFKISDIANVHLPEKIRKKENKLNKENYETFNFLSIKA